jgi:hypothetical protein
VAGLGSVRPKWHLEVFHRREKGRDVTYVVLIIIAVVLLAGLFYVRGRRT